MNFIEKWKSHNVNKGKIAIAWLGQAGYLIKNSYGKTLALDAYLSDIVERVDGNKRLMMALFEAKQLKPDLALASHEHLDHLDTDTISIWINNGVKLYCNSASLEYCKENGIDSSNITVMNVGDIQETDGYRIEAVFADHGDTAPTAIGFLIETDGVLVYFTGDTSYQMTRLNKIAARKPTIMLTVINGEYGNMNERDAAMLAELVSPKVTVPCHFGMFVRHLGRPFDFVMSMNVLAPQKPYYIMGQGEIIDVTAEGIDKV